ncbi:Ig-like domain-containing protein [Lachnospiraceae bacterium 45-W7]
MKHLKGSLLTMLLVIMGCIFWETRDVKAAEPDFFEEYSYGVSDDHEEYYFSLEYKCSLTIYMEGRQEYEYSYDGGEMSVILDKEDGIFAFDKTIDLPGSFKKTITLEAGEYDLYVESEGPYYIALSGEYYPELSEDEITLEVGKTKKLKVNRINSKVKWSSSKKSVATVNNKGVVRAKKAGEATIMAECDGKKLKCIVTVEKKPASYRVISRKMRTFAKKNKNYKFKTIDVGNKCCLYACSAKALSSESKIYSEGYVMYSSLYPYIELVKKKNDEPEIRLKYFGETVKISAYGFTSLYCITLKAFTSNRRMNFMMKNIYNKYYYNYSNYYYEGRMKGYSIISTSSKLESSKLKKFKTMLKQSSLSMRITSFDDTYMQISISTAIRRNWDKLLKEYELLLKEF